MDTPLIVAQAPTMDEFVKLLSAYIAEYNRTPNNGIDMNGKCPDEVYFENLSVKQVVSDLDALRLLCGNFRVTGGLVLPDNGPGFLLFLGGLDVILLGSVAEGRGF